MDYIKLFGSFAIAFVVAFGIFSWVNHLNTSYIGTGAGVIDTGFYTETDLQNISTYAPTKTLELGGVLDLTAVKDTSDDTSSSQTRGAIAIANDMIGFVPKMFGTTLNAIGVPQEYVNMAKFAFGFAFAFTAILLLYTGLRGRF